MAPNDAPIALSLLSQAFPADKAKQIYEEKIQQRPLRLKPTSASERPSTTQNARRQARLHKLASRKRKLKPAPLSARRKRALGLYDIPKSAQRYEIYEPLHQMWIGYIQEVLWDSGKFFPVTPQTAAKLASADFHGAELEAVRSTCVSRVGVKGIVVKDCKFVFEVITKNNSVKVLPKEGTIFRFCVPAPTFKKEGVESQDESNGKAEASEERAENETPTKDLVFELHGDQFEFRAADRANRKFKTHFLKDL